MEMTCTRCHQGVPAESTYCPACGLPQLVYAAEPGSVPPPTERWPEAARDAGSIDWKRGMRAAALWAIPAGLLCSGISPVSPLAIFWMAGAAAWAVVVYMRGVRPAWITMGAGARIGLVTGLMAAWIAFGISGAGLFVTRVLMHQGSQIDSAWREVVDKQQALTQQWYAQMSLPNNPAELLAQRNFELSPEGHAGFQAMGLIFSCSLLVLFAAAGGALSARMSVRSRSPKI